MNGAGAGMLNPTVVQPQQVQNQQMGANNGGAGGNGHAAASNPAFQDADMSGAGGNVGVQNSQGGAGES